MTSYFLTQVWVQDISTGSRVVCFLLYYKQSSVFFPELSEVALEKCEQQEAMKP